MSQKAESTEAAAKREADQKKGAGKPAAAAPAGKGKPGSVVEETPIVRTEAETEADKNRLADEGLALSVELWTRLAR